MREFIARLIAVSVVALTWIPGYVSAQNTTEERLQKIEEQMQEVQLGLERETSKETKDSGHGAISFHGYGEFHYNHPVVEGGGFPVDGDRPTLDFHRLVWGLSYTFNDRLSLHTEIDFEHAAQEIELEFAYIEYQWSDTVSVRVGSLMMPVGPLNEFHEPPGFYSVERPYVQKYIIPTTWQEGGVGLLGQLLPGLKYRVYFVGGLDASGFTALEGIKDGKQVLFEDENKAFDFGGVGRLEYTGVPGFSAGASFYSAPSGQNDPFIGKAQVTLWDVDLEYHFKGFDFIGLYAQSRIGDADRISAVTGETIGSKQTGWYTELAYHLSRLIDSTWDLVPFVRWEAFDTQAGISSLDRTPGTDRKVLTGGLAYYPHPDFAVKADYERWEDDTDETAVRYNLGIAFQF